MVLGIFDFHHRLQKPIHPFPKINQRGEAAPKSRPAPKLPDAPGSARLCFCA
jgi:hypothetical protein